MKGESHEFYAIGKISKAFGVRGDVVVAPMTQLPARFKKLKYVYIGPRGDLAQKHTVRNVRVEARGTRMQFLEVTDRAGAERLAGSLLFVDETQRVSPKKGSYFIHDIIGLRVVDERNVPLGVVKDVLRYPAQDVYVVEDDGREWMIPAVKEFIQAIDTDGGRMTVRVIEGMRNEN